MLKRPSWLAAIEARAWLSLGIAMSWGLAACGGGSVAAPVPVQSPTAVQHATLMVNGHKRTYRVFRPPSLDMKQAAPLVLALHGGGSTGDEMASISHFDDEATSGGFIVAYPDAAYGTWKTAAPAPVEDVNFIGRLLNRLETEFTIDKTRIFITGASKGAVMAYRLACELSDRIAAIASVSGRMELKDCRPARPVSILEMHGTDDALVPYEGGASAIKNWVTLDGCAGNPTQTLSGITKTAIWMGCRGGTVVRFDTVVGGRHTWFGSAYDPVPGEPSSSAEVWGFFSSLAPRS
jgi:polyhydroxybutyrate depolymerase